MNWTRKTAPTVQPIDLAEAKSQCRIDASLTDQDSVIALYIEAATAWVEDYTGRSLMTQTHQVSLCAFPSRVWLPRAAPLASVTFVKYYDAANALQTLSSSVYTTPAFAEPASLSLAYGQSWPTTYDRDDAVQIEYVTGVSDPANVPPALKQAAQLLVGHWFANRESVIVGTISAAIQFSVASLCAPHRLTQRIPQWEPS
jgi:uncharacterized phiE125 gp8 family phage protein